jgi:hypothetical protein
MEACFGRRTNVKDRVHFGNGIHWVYPENACSNLAMPGEKLCQLCFTRDATTGRLQAQPRYPHGIIGEAIPPSSQIYGGPWYEAGILKWGMPFENDLKFLEEASQSIMKKYFPQGKLPVVTKETIVTVSAATPSNTVVKNREKVGGIIVAVELDEDPIIAEEVVECVLKSVTIKGVTYYMDNMENLYIKNKNSSVGTFCGKLVGGEISV